MREETNTDERVRNLRLLDLFVLALGFGMGAFAVVDVEITLVGISGYPPGTGLIGLWLMGALMLGVRVLGRRGQLRAASILLVGGTSVLVTAALYLFPNQAGQLFFAYILPVAMAGTLLGSPAAFGLATLALVLFVGAGSLAISRGKVPAAWDWFLVALTSNGVILYVLAALVWFYTRSLTEALVTARHRAQALAEANATLQRVEQQRDEFTRALVHDIRALLHTVLGALNLVRQSQLSPDESQEMLDVAVASGRRLSEMAEELLAISRLQAGALPLDRQPTPLPPLLEATLGHCALLAHQKGITLAGDWSPDGPVVEIDRGVVERVLTNLLDNAVKFTGPGGLVTLHARPEDDSVLLQVQDTGPGIPLEAQPNLFGPFYQVDGRREAGHGLGLAFCKAAVEAHGGRIWVDSQPGCGATFSVRLPATSESRKQKAEGSND
jgi:signal transduction histidine kinase